MEIGKLLAHHRCCWLQKSANVLNKVPKAVQPKIKEALQETWMAGSRDAAYISRFEVKYPKAMDGLAKVEAQGAVRMGSTRSGRC